QAEDGIRDDLVTGVQTCALPIYLPIASTWAGDTLSFTSGSRPSCRRCVRFRYSRPAAWPAADGLNLTASQTLSGGSWGWAPKSQIGRASCREGVRGAGGGGERVE